MNVNLMVSPLALRLLNGLLEVFTPGSSSYRLHPLMVLGFISIVSVVLFLVDYTVLLVLLGCLATILSIIRGVRVLAKTAMYSLIFTSPYILSALVIQWLSGFWDIYLVLTGFLRMLSLILLSTIALSLIDLVWLVKTVSRISPSLGVLLALSFKLTHMISLNAKLLLELYNVNLGVTSKARRILLVTRATTYLSFNTMLSFMEAFYTRKHLILKRRQ